MVKTCGTCQWWDDNGVCDNDNVDIYQTGENGVCPYWIEWDGEYWYDKDYDY